MKIFKNIYVAAIVGVSLFASCSKEDNEIQFTPAVQIKFDQGGDSSIVNVDKGVTSVPVKIDVSAGGQVIRSFEIYNADAKTGARGALIAGTTQTFPTASATYSTTYTVAGLTDNKAIKVVVTDTLSQVYEKNILLRITPAVVFSNSLKAETVENYYGPYVATWLSGRVYMRNTPNTKEIDFSLGDVTLTQGGTTKTAALVNPSMRGQFNLLTPTGVQSTKYALTTLKAADYNAITKVNAKPITDLADPTLDAVALQAGNVYVFKTANGKKGLIHVSAVAAKTGTVETTSGNWESANYSEVTMTTKTVMP